MARPRKMGVLLLSARSPARPGPASPTPMPRTQLVIAYHRGGEGPAPPLVSLVTNEAT